jgi:hypothetical protein
VVTDLFAAMQPLPFPRYFLAIKVFFICGKDEFVAMEEVSGAE